MSSLTSSSVIEEPAAPPRRPSRLAAIAKSVCTVFQFEFKKSRTWKRMLVWAGVSMFPAFIVFLMLFNGDSLPRGAWISAVFVMACEMVVILNALLWVAPIVQTELEGKTWLYVVTRPYGRICLVLGKLLNGLTWTLGAGLLALALVGVVAWIKALPIDVITGTRVETTALMDPEHRDQLIARGRELVHQLQNPVFDRQFERNVRNGDDLFRDLPVKFSELESAPGAPLESIPHALRVGGVLAVLTLLAGLAYSSLFCGIGCIVPKRAMLIAFSYTLIFETVVAFVPAIVNRITIQYHLRCLLNRWVDLEMPVEGQELFFSHWPAWWHLAVLGGMIALWQMIALLVVHLRQYVMTDET